MCMCISIFSPLYGSFVYAVFPIFKQLGHSVLINQGKEMSGQTKQRRIFLIFILQLNMINQHCNSMVNISVYIYLEKTPRYLVILKVLKLYCS